MNRSLVPFPGGVSAPGSLSAAVEGMLGVTRRMERTIASLQNSIVADRGLLRQVGAENRQLRVEIEALRRQGGAGNRSSPSPFVVARRPARRLPSPPRFAPGGLVAPVRPNEDDDGKISFLRSLLNIC